MATIQELEAIQKSIKVLLNDANARNEYVLVYIYGRSMIKLSTEILRKLSE